MGSDSRGENLPNGLDFFWDGQGAGSCWQDAHPSGTEPIAVPACPAGGQQRLIADPNKLVLFIDCTRYKLAAKILPAGCDWFGTPPRPGVFAASITIQSVAPAVQFIAVLVVFAMLVRRRGRPGLLAISASCVAGLGSILLLLASTEQFWHLAAPGIAILGIGWLGAVRLVPTRRLAVLTLVLGLVALFEAVDTGVVLLPVPVGPVWSRVVLEVAWIAWIGAALVTATRTHSSGGNGCQTELRSITSTEARLTDAGVGVGR
jgi:hypothetical protein